MLNPKQQAAVHAASHVLVIACPGSGKTHTLEKRAVLLLQQHPAARVIACTFTREAAGELAARIRKCDPGAARRLTGGTFHSLALTQLEQLGKRPTLLKEWRTRDLMRRAYTETVRSADVLKFEDACRGVEAIKSQPDGPPNDDAPITKMYRRYQDLLGETGGIDFADCLLLAVAGMRDGSIKPLEGRFLLVDEAQDMDAVQLAWVLAHLSAGLEVTVVADDDQSIYKFRQALGIKGLLAFQRAANAPQIALDLTYRCAPEVLAAASKLIAHNTERMPKELRTVSRAEGSVTVERFTQRTKEALAVIAAVRDCRDRGCTDSWAVLARNNAHLDDIECQMKGVLPFRRIGGKGFWDQLGPSLFLGVLGGFLKEDMLGVEAMMARTGIAPSLIDRLHAYYTPSARGSMLGFLRIDMSGARGGDVQRIATVQALLRQWCRMLASRHPAHGAHGIEQVAHAVAVHLGGALVTAGKVAPTEQDIAYNTRILTGCAERIARMSGTLQERIETLLRGEEPDDPAMAVSLMTLHGSKGLEFDRVWIIAVEQGVLPASGSDDEEERRLLYVGMTRARQHLTLSYTVGKDASGKDAARSLFLDEAGLL